MVSTQMWVRLPSTAQKLPCVVVSQLVTAPGCGPGSDGFDPRTTNYQELAEEGLHALALEGELGAVGGAASSLPFKQTFALSTRFLAFRPRV